MSPGPTDEVSPREEVRNYQQASGRWRTFAYLGRPICQYYTSTTFVDFLGTLLSKRTTKLHKKVDGGNFLVLNGRIV